MSEELEVLKEVARRLTGAGIPYMITGSIAANFYSIPRMTRDIDLVVELGDAGVARLVATLRDDFYVDLAAVEGAVRERGMFNAIHTRHIVKVDFVVRKDSDYRREEFARRTAVSVEGSQIFMVTAEDLILSKLDWARDTRSEIQLTDVRNLLTSVEGLDRAYLSRWAARLGLDALLREVGG